MTPPHSSTASSSAALICLAAGLRAAAVSLAGVIIAIHFAERGLSAAGIGLIIGVGIASSALGTVITGLRADAWGRRRTLVALGAIGGLGYTAIAVTDRLPILIAVAAVAMVNGMGRDRGPASALEQALLPSTTSDDRRTWTMAWYNATIDTGHAIGALAAVTPTVLVRMFDVSVSRAHSLTFLLCGAAVALSIVPYLFLDARVEASSSSTPSGSVEIDGNTRGIVRRLAMLFALDSTGGGFLNSALVSYWFFEQYGMTEVQIAGLFFAARVLNVVSHLAAAWLAKRFGLVNTMVFTHLPSSVFLMLAPGAPTAAIAGGLFLAREALVEMDVPTRQSYTMAVVPPSARTYASSMTNVTRNAGWAVGSLASGTVMQYLSFSGPLVIGGALKIVYDLALYRSFRNLRPPEEQPRVS